jgi:hypothetical protein
LLNFSDQPASFYIDHPAIPGNYLDLFSGEQVEVKRKQHCTFDPGEYAAYHITLSV